ncbi:beta-carotene isomerase domain-containing protein [Lyngbya confervoides]|uniref:Beta-carotene isomerase domain-containing protein n=1 Tax=Lyngbya confervoides BDU141951 TaxID=1574623 RepID=A0ABD4T781_9CYAN|nr:beta-carotene isomerase domain-containing protein [Lyngbya confervoides]MCM1984588.1 beta-carotene isomerase domain-containing protein [Lyngbya confervoides BDU141951]
MEDPGSSSISYRDNWFDRLFIRLFSRKIAVALGEQTQQAGYDGFVDLSQRIMAGRSPQEQQQLVGVVLRSLVPAPVLWGVRTFFSPTPLVCELNAWFATRLFEWLVGPCTVQPAQVTTPSGAAREQKSMVKIERCRYLDQSGCVAMCINMCKLPTQEFFTRDFGIPVTLTPNFEDFSCEMVFGSAPPPLQSEAIATQPCLPRHCNQATPTDYRPCPKIHP